MLKKLVYCYVIAFLACFYGNVNTGYAQSDQSLPAVVGQKTLSASESPHEFFAEDGTGNGLITEITAGEYWLYVFGINADGVTGSPRRKVRFNLEDQEGGSSLKSLGVSLALEQTGPNGNDRLECYQDYGFDGSSGQNLPAGTINGGTFDLRFQFTRANPDSGWQLTPYYRLAGGSWILFFDDVFTGSETFDFLGAKLVVRIEPPLGGTVEGDVSFDNFFVITPPTGDATTTFVDDDWADLDPGDAVQFPGQSKIQIIGFDAFAAVQDGIDSLYLAMNGDPALELNNLNGFYKSLSAQTTLNSVATIDTVHVAAGTYIENLDIYFPLVLDGAGSGVTGPGTTFIKSAGIDTAVIHIDGSTASGISPTERVVIRDLRVTDAAGSDSRASGIQITHGDDVQTTTNFITFDNVVSVGNEHSGIAIEHTGIINDVEVINCVLSDNGINGFYIWSEISSFDSLLMTGGKIDSNGINGLAIGYGMTTLNGDNFIKTNSTLNGVLDGPPGITNIHINGTSLLGNGNVSTYGSGDISLFDFNGNASFTNVTVEGETAQFGIQIHGDEQIGPAGSVSFDSVSISGIYQNPENRIATLPSFSPPPPPIPLNAAGLYISNYNSVDNISFNNVQIDVSSSEGPVANLFVNDVDDTLNIGTTIFGGNATADIHNLAPVDIDAGSAIFTGALTNFDIEDRVIHIIDLAETVQDDVAVKTKQALLQIPGQKPGLVTWVPNNVYLTPDSFFEPYTFSPSIQRAINAASSGDTVNVGIGEFQESPQDTINKDLTIIGSGTQTTIIRANEDTGGDSGDSRGWFLVNSGVTFLVSDMTFDGTGRQISEAFRVNGQGSFTNVNFNEIKINDGGPPDYDGIAIAARGDGPVDVTNCTFTEIGRIGAKYTGSDVSSSVFSGNTYTGKDIGDYLDYAVDIRGGASVEVIGCTISDNLGLVTPNDSFSAGILIIDSDNDGTVANINDNEIFNSTSAIHVGLDTLDNSFVVTDQNVFYNNDYGLFISSALFIKVQKDSIHDNTVGIDINHVNFFDIENNNIYNNGNGVIIENSTSGDLDNNIINNNTTNGITIGDEESTGTTMNRNEFCSNGVFGIENQGQSLVDATLNWWGASNGPSGEGIGSGDTVSTNVDFSSFETNTLFPDSPCPEPAVLIATKIFLQGPYNSSTDKMSTTLGDVDQIPLTSPHSEDPRTVTNIPNNVVDWVLVEIRETDGGPTVASKSVFLHKDGRIVADDGATGEISLNLVAEGNYYIIIKHRNHLSIISANSVALSHTSSTLYDFTTGQSQASGSEPMAEIETDVFGMRSGDGNGDGGVDSADKDEIWLDQNGTAWSYTKMCDFNLDGGIDATDSNLFWRPNNGTATQVPVN